LGDTTPENQEPSRPGVGGDGAAGGDVAGAGEAAAGDQTHSPRSAKDSFEKRALHEVVHVWLPLAIVLVSVCAAIVGWRASVSDEHATHTEELSRQDLVHQQQLLIQDNNAVDADIRLFGQFAQSSALAHALLGDAGQVGGQLSDQLRVDGQAQLDLARTFGKQIQNVDYAFDPSNPTGNSYVHADGTYAGTPYDAQTGLGYAESNDFDLHGLEPEQLLARAESQHQQGVDFTGIAAMLVGVLVLLTLGAVVRGPIKLWFAGSGAVVALAALALFLTTQLG
jgi:hypothetical protein